MWTNYITIETNILVFTYLHHLKTILRYTHLINQLRFTCRDIFYEYDIIWVSLDKIGNAMPSFILFNSSIFSYPNIWKMFSFVSYSAKYHTFVKFPIVKHSLQSYLNPWCRMFTFRYYVINAEQYLMRSTWQFHSNLNTFDLSWRRLKFVIKIDKYRQTQENDDDQTKTKYAKHLKLNNIHKKIAHLPASPVIVSVVMNDDPVSKF